MVYIELSIFKYGTFKEKEIKTFSSEDEVFQWIAIEDVYKKQMDNESEDMIKWSANFLFNKKNYRIYLDL